jgi:uncharacterized protein YdeI (YjbR/CyaY-like superfamily)
METAIPAGAVQPFNRAEWRSWLESNHTRAAGIWLVVFKKSSEKQTYTFDEAVEEALCFGWIDSKPGKLDEERSMLYFSPRKAGTGWSRVNKERIERMIAAGRMTMAGQARIDAAKADGTWHKLDAVEKLVIPADLEAALATAPPADEYFAAFPRSVKRGILEWIEQAKQPVTRAKRVEETARMARENQRANQWNKKSV